jgi:hypothetical protein
MPEPTPTNPLGDAINRLTRGSQTKLGKASETNSVLGLMLSSRAFKDREIAEIIQDTAELLVTKSEDYGPVAECLDLIAAATGYDKANVPAGEAASAYRALAKIIRYMNLRAKTSINHESIKETLQDTVGESLRLYGEAVFNVAGESA